MRSSALARTGLAAASVPALLAPSAAAGSTTRRVPLRGSIPTLGGTYVYQATYRDASASFCPPASSNRTNGLRVLWRL